MNQVAEVVAQNLHLDVPRVADIAFHIKGVVTESSARFGRGGAKRRVHVSGIPDELDSTATAASGRFKQDGVADLFRKRSSFARIARVLRTGHGRNARGLGDSARLKLIAHFSYIIRSGADKCNLIISARLSQLGSFREKAVAGMERVAACSLRSSD